jgi:hypothetical protein
VLNRLLVERGCTENVTGLKPDTEAADFQLLAIVGWLRQAFGSEVALKATAARKSWGW